MTLPFVKKFDFRGIYGKDIKDSDAYYLGLALEKTLPLKKILLGWDTRESSKNLAYNFINALKAKHIVIFYMDKCSIDYVTAAASAFDFDLSIMFTGSHNPWTWTGLLMHTKGGDSIQGELVEKIVVNYYASLKEPYENPEIDLSHFKNFYLETESVYTEKIKELVPLYTIKAFNVLVDIGDGSGSRALSVAEKLLPQVTFTRINDRTIYDEQSPHIADPSNIENMKDLIAHTKTGKYDCGFAFDSDADRVLGVDENGEYLNGSLLGSVQMSALLKAQGADKYFGYAVDCGSSFCNSIIEFSKTYNGLSVKPIPVGRSIVRQMLRYAKMDFAVENVGHFYSKDFFMTDSGVFSLILTLYWMSENGSLTTLKQKYPDGERGQVSLQVLNKEQIQDLVSQISKYFVGQQSKKIDVDGVRYEFYDGEHLSSWYTIRKSGYEETTKCYFGSLDKTTFKFLKSIFKNGG